jgi:hypothetical protein
MKIRIAQENRDAEVLLPPAQPDGSRIGINYADAYIKVLNRTLEDGRKIICKRRGLQIMLTVGDRKGEGLMRRLENGPDPKGILFEALREAARNAGIGFSVENTVIYLEIS